MIIIKKTFVGLVFANCHRHCLHLVLTSFLSIELSWDTLFTSVIWFHLKVLTSEFIHICMLVIDVLYCFPKCIRMQSLHAFWLQKKVDLSHLSDPNRCQWGHKYDCLRSVKCRIAILLVYLTHFGSKMDCFMSTMNQALVKSSWAH